MYSVGWYVLHCKSGQEETIIRSCKHHLSKPALDDAFQISYERMKKYLGEWHVDTYRMFPDYVFLQSSRPELLLKELKQYRDITDVLAQEDMLLPVQPEEEAMIRTLCGERHHMGLSRGLVRNGSFRAVNGPLAGKEALIRKLDLHKRIAVLNLKPVKENKDIWAGIEILPGE